jgi:bifunctional non-homologous end joining protein LigD
MNDEIQISMSYQEGTSDKVYHAYLKDAGAGSWNVYGEYGRRGAVMLHADKGRWPSWPLAKKHFDDLVKEKTRKGYQIDYDSSAHGGAVGSSAGLVLPATVSPKIKKDSGIVVQLSNQIDLDRAAELIHDDEWFMQEKVDGQRRPVRKFNADVLGINRKGEIVPLPRGVSVEIGKFTEDKFVIDGELVGEHLYVFDMLEGKKDIRSLSYDSRLANMSSLLPVSGSGKFVTQVRTARTAAEKREMFDLIQSGGGEGVVFKRADAPYTGGRPASGGTSLKYKFYETASFIVIDVNKKRSVNVGLFDTVTGDLTDVGNVTIPPNFDVPEKDVIIEVRYLYAFPGGSIYQPTYLGQRHDIEKFECVIDQLKFKQV